MKFLSHFIYESLTYLYTLTGLTAVLKIPGKLGAACCCCPSVCWCPR